ncbi:MAG: DUF2169 domain-containing protein [Polyangiaceae bacterium]|nr:DUF2169 domain-containing protein [Polyangiaceae bacterium]
MPIQAVAKSVPDSPTTIVVRSEAPFAIGAVLWRDESARVLATIVAKATYKLAQGTSQIVDEPDPIRHSDERVPSDLAPFKSLHEVLVVGHADGDARIVVGTIEKKLAPARSGEPAPVVGFGPLSRPSPSGDSHLRPEDRAWLKDPLGHPRPRGFDPGYFCAAPEEQRSAEALRADQRVILEGLDPTHARLETNLAGVAPSLRSVLLTRELPPFIGDTLYIDIDRRIATLVFRAIVPLDEESLILEVVAAQPDRPKAATRGPAEDVTTELDRSALGDLGSPDLPFPTAPANEPSREAAPKGADAALPFRSAAPKPASAPPPVTPALASFQLAAAAPVAAPPASFPPATPSFPLASRPLALVPPSRPPTVRPLPTAPVIEPLEPATERPPAAGFKRRAIVDLLAFERAVPNRLRRSKTHAALLSDLASQTLKKLESASAEEDTDDRARHDVLRVLSCGTPLGADELQAAFGELLDEPHDFELPLFVIEGDVRPTMDEVETLRVAAELAKPLAGNSNRVHAAIAAANEALGRSARPVSAAALALYKQLEASTNELSLPSRHLADLVDRTLLETRSFKKRMLLGAPRIRADVTLGAVTLPIYLPDDATTQLPLLPVFSLTALVEVRPREDASEENPSALVAYALGRVLRARK